MTDEIFGRPTFAPDSHGISHLTYTPLQGIERLARGLWERAQRMAEMRPFMLKGAETIGKRNRIEWAIGQDRVGAITDEETGEKRGGFIVRVELRDFGSECPEPINGTWPDRLLHQFYKLLPLERLLMLSCYTPEGFYIGNLDTALFLYGTLGLSEVQPFGVAVGNVCAFEAIEKRRTCSVGFSEEKQAWVGWSHRGWADFPIGYVAKEDDVVTSSGYCPDYLEEHPEKDLSVPVGFEVKTLDDSKRCAIAYAESIS